MLKIQAVGGADEAVELFKARRYKESIEACLKLLEKDSNSTKILNLTSAIYLNLGEYAKAREHSNKSLKIDKNQFLVQYYVGVSYLSTNPKKALSYINESILLNSEYAPAYLILGNYYYAKRDFSFAEKNYLLAKKSASKNSEVDYALAKLYLTTKDYKKGFSLFRVRYNPLFKGHENAPLADRKNLLSRGVSVEGQRVLITIEQGFGDYIQFIRFLPLLLEKRPVKIYIATSEPLKKLIMHNYTSNQLHFLEDRESVSFDKHFPIVEFGYLFDIKSSAIPHSDGYLSVNKEESKAFFKENFKKSKKIKIGISYKGNHKHADDQNRSIELDDFLYMIEPFMEKFDFYSLQYEPQESEKQALRESGIIELDNISNFYDTALAIDNLDYVITVDTSVVHLSGAMGKPTILLIPFVQDWRWGYEGKKSEWYDSITIFRQHKHSCWGGAFCDIKSFLENL